jgi:hypothetical protein
MLAAFEVGNRPAAHYAREVGKTPVETNIGVYV